MRGKYFAQAALALSAVICVLGMTAGPAGAAIIYEGFNYSEGLIDGTQAGGAGLAGAGWMTSGSTQFQTVVSPGLEFTGLSTEGNAIRRGDRAGKSEMHRGISAASQAALTADNSTIWFSLLVDTETSYAKGNNFTFMLATDAVADPGQTNMTLADGGEGIGISFLLNNAGATLTGMVVDDGTSTRSADSIGPFTGNDLLLIAGKIDWAADGSDDTLTLYSITDPAAALPAPFATMTGDLAQSQFDTLAIGDKQRAVVDEIRFGNTSGDVLVPEPASLAIMALGGMAAMWRRRRS